MTRILIQRGSTSSSSSNPNRPSSFPGSSSTRVESQNNTSPVVSAVKDEEFSEEMEEQVVVDEFLVGGDSKPVKSEEIESLGDNKIVRSSDEAGEAVKPGGGENSGVDKVERELVGLKISERVAVESEGSSSGPSPAGSESQRPPPPPVPPPRPSAMSSNSRRFLSGNSNSPRNGAFRRAGAWPVVSARTSPSRSRPSSPRSYVDGEGYNSADEQNPSFVSSYDDLERERQFEIDLRRAKGLEVRRMLEDGNCLFHAVADQVYGDSEAYDLVRQMCIDYMERERDHFSQFITEGFTSYCKRKRRDKVYGNNVEIQALSEMYNRPIHIYSYSTEPINIFHGSYNTDLPPIKLSFHHGNHYNSLVDPRRLTIGAGLGFSCLRGNNVDRDQVKAAIKAQQDQQIDNALLAEGRFYSDLELTEKEIERMVMEASRAEYLATDKFKQQFDCKQSSTSTAEPSSSAANSSGSEAKLDAGKEHGVQSISLSNSMQILLSMGFSYLQAIEAYSIFGDDVDSMVCYLLETSSSSRRKGKATE